MKLIAFDPGARRTGWAYFDTEKGSTLRSVGLWRLEREGDEVPGLRWVRLRRLLDKLITVSDLSPDLASYEKVRRHLGVDAAHAYGGVESHLQAWAAWFEIPLSTVAVGSAKKVATGYGNAKKDEMLAAARARWPLLEFKTDDVADAAFVGLATLVDRGLARPAQKGEAHGQLRI